MRAPALAAVLLLAGCGQAGPFAVMETSKGRMVARLYPDRAPKTIAHLRALAGRPKPFYNGLTFFRVIPGFLIQTGDPAGTGRGDPGLPVPDEIRPGDRFDKPGLLGMASWGPGTSQTQFFITLGPAPDLDGLHTQFGELIEGLEVAQAIAAVPRETRDGIDRPFDPPVLKSFKIVLSRP
ncbi:MAG: peptidylprolyl isomerase [Elusimicrobiota bacterium]|nr:peptidylprolyl isomerase [Elusimicrobiota bacterium]